MEAERGVPDAPRKPPFKILRPSLFISCVCSFAVCIAAASPSPYLASHARDAWGSSPIGVAIIFALDSFAKMVTSPGAGYLCGTLGRSAVLLTGLAGLTGSSVLFSLSGSQGMAMASRALMGASSAMLNVSTLAMLAAESVLVGSDLASDMGLVEVISGLSFVLGPPVGGLFFEYLGYVNGNLSFAALPACTLLMVLAVLPQQCRRRRGGLPPPATASGSPESGDRRRRSLATTTTAFALLGLALSFAAFGFLDPTLAGHAEKSLGVDSAGAGGIFAIGGLAYALLGAPLAAYLSHAGRLGPRRCIVLGTGLLGAGFVGMGGFVIASYPRGAAWAVIVLSVTLLGVGVAMGLIATLPAMKEDLARRGVDVAEDATTNRLSAFFSFAQNGGETVGPLIGGALVSVLPETTTAGCSGDGCASSFPLASSAFGALLLCFSGAAAAAGLCRAAPAEERRRAAEAEQEPLLA